MKAYIGSIEIVISKYHGSNLWYFSINLESLELYRSWCINSILTDM